MALTLYYHPLSSYCWKVLIALYEADVPFTPRQVNLSDPADRAAFTALWPLAKFPLLRDEGRAESVPESTIIIEYLAERFAGARRLLPTDAEQARPVRLLDRLFDQYVHQPLQQVVGERLRPEGQHDPYGAEQARAQLRRGYALLEPLVVGPWAAGESFTLADCAALPALFYGDYAVRLEGWPRLAGYLERLKARPSIDRVLKEAQPWLAHFPLRDG